FSRIHPKFKTPSFSTILTGFVEGITALFLNLDLVLALTSIGKLFAFVLLCAGISVVDNRAVKVESKFKVPFINAKYVYPLMLVSAIILIIRYAPVHCSFIVSAPGILMLFFWIVAITPAVLSFFYR